jgi:hypothetical protein
MAKLSQAQIAMYAQSAGMSNPVLMSAIAMAESSGNTTAHNPIGLDDSYGLWQINMLGDMGPARRREFGISRNADLFDPAVNARAAAKILGGQGLRAWSTYTNGAYKKYMPASQGGVIQASEWDDFWKGFKDGFDVGPGPEDLFDGGMKDDPSLGDALGGAAERDFGVEGVAEGLGAISEATVKAAQWMGQSKNWVRVGYVVGGGLLVGMGLYIMASPLLGKAMAATPGAQALKKTITSPNKAKRTTPEPAAKAPAAKTKGSTS